MTRSCRRARRASGTETANRRAVMKKSTAVCESNPATNAALIPNNTTGRGLSSANQSQKCEHAHREAEACGQLRASLACRHDHPLVARQGVEKDEHAQGCAPTKQKGRPERGQQCKVKGIGERDRLGAASEDPDQSRMDRGVVVDREVVGAILDVEGRAEKRRAEVPAFGQAEGRVGVLVVVVPELGLDPEPVRVHAEEHQEYRQSDKPGELPHFGSHVRQCGRRTGAGGGSSPLCARASWCW